MSCSEVGGVHPEHVLKEIKDSSEQTQRLHHKS